MSKCFVCARPFDALAPLRYPVLFPCGHGVCRECADALLTGGFRCPLCDKVFDSFTKNYQFIEYLEELAHLPSTTGTAASSALLHTPSGSPVVPDAVEGQRGGVWGAIRADGFWQPYPVHVSASLSGLCSAREEKAAFFTNPASASTYSLEWWNHRQTNVKTQTVRRVIFVGVATLALLTSPAHTGPSVFWEYVDSTTHEWTRFHSCVARVLEGAFVAGTQLMSYNFAGTEPAVAPFTHEVDIRLMHQKELVTGTLSRVRRFLA